MNGRTPRWPKIPGLSRPARYVWACLWLASGRLNRIKLEPADIADALGLAERGVVAALDELAKCGAIRRTGPAIQLLVTKAAFRRAQARGGRP